MLTFTALLQLKRKEMNLFFVQSNGQGEVFMDETESRHCIKVLRHQLHDIIQAIDGKGNQYSCRIVDITKKQVQLEVVSKIENWGEKEQHLHLIISPLRQRDRFEWAIEKAVELGVNQITPIICKRTVKTGLKIPRLQTIAQSALKQSKRSLMPLIAAPISISSCLSKPLDGIKLIGWCETEAPIQGLHGDLKRAQAVHVLIGPEGDFDAEEVALAQGAGFKEVSLGTNRLRTETAAIHVLGIIKYVQGW
jgi:16S rRNA (uracil1498-N3)-methyltransferase